MSCSHCSVASAVILQTKKGNVLIFPFTFVFAAASVLREV